MEYSNVFSSVMLSENGRRMPTTYRSEITDFSKNKGPTIRVAVMAHHTPSDDREGQL
jgi:hypothetical protein